MNAVLQPIPMDALARRTAPVRVLHQIEMTSRCNLRCRYCVHHKMPRAKADMTEETYVRALEWVQYFAVRGQRELNLAGIGESTMHPEFIRFLALAREKLPVPFRLVVTTNGVAVTEEMVRAMQPHSPSVFVSLHRPEKAGPALELFKKYKMLEGASVDPAVEAINWAGQVQWHVSVRERRDCSWIRFGKVMAMSDGRVTRCSLDGSGAGTFAMENGLEATVHDDLSKLRTSMYSLCAGCDQIPWREERQNVNVGAVR